MSKPVKSRKATAPRRRRVPKSNPKNANVRRGGWLARLVGRLAYWALIGGIWGGVALGGVLAFYAYDLPDVDDAFTATRRPGITVLANDGSELASVGDLYGMPVTLRDLPPALPQAVIATEDRRFYHHFGLDVIGLARAMWTNIRAGRIRQGGSTLTQQVAKNLFLTPERTIKRKMQELLLALWLEQKFSKDEILTVYLNRVYLGKGAWGMDAAARKYFGRPASEVSTWQAATLAALLKAPSRLNPIRDPEAANARAEIVLRNMVNAGYLSAEAAQAAKRDKNRKVASKQGGGSRYFVDWVLEHIPDYVTLDRDVVVRTTLIPRIQRAADLSVARSLDGEGRKQGISQAAMVILSPAGAVHAMVGGRAYARSQFNRATQAQRQPGSAFKPLVYLSAMEAGLDARSVIIDEPIDINGWKPRNFNKKYQGAMALRDALAQSVNTVAVKLAQHAGMGNVVKAARRFGISGKLEPHPSLALGAAEVSLLELSGAYAVFANGGIGVWPYAILEIAGRDGTVLYARSGDGPGRVIAPRHAASMNAMLAHAVRTGTGHRAALAARSVAGKTGTSQNNRDGWFVGYSADLVGGVWMGNDDASPAKGLTGGGLPAQIWHDAMLTAHEGYAVKPLYGTQSPERENERGLLGGLLSSWFGGDG